MTDQEIALQRRAARLIEREVHACMSSLIDTLSGADYEHGADSLGTLMDQACQLADYVLDYDGAATEAGWVKNGGVWAHDDFEDAETSAEAACSASDVDPHEIEVFEHWAVSQWLAEKLAAKGERVDTDFAGLNVWARTTTGQAISADSVIEAITTETGYASGGEA